jgi:hypothetical protein
LTLDWIGCEPMDRACQIVDSRRFDQQTLDLLLDQRAQMRTPPTHDRQPRPQRLADGASICLDPTGECEDVGRCIQRAELGGGEGAVDYDAIDQIGLLDALPYEPAVPRVHIGPTDEMQGDVVGRQERDGLEQLDDPLVRQPVGDIEQPHSAPCSQRWHRSGVGEIASRLDDLESFRLESVLLAELASQERPRSDDPIAATICGEVDAATECTYPPGAVRAAGVLMRDRNGDRTASASHGDSHGPCIQAVDEHDIGTR